MGHLAEVVLKTIAAWVFASVLVLSSHTQPVEVTTKPSVPCFDPNPGAIYQEVTQP